MFFNIQNQQIKLFVFVKPNAKKTTCVGVVNGELHIALHAKPHQGEANKELINYLAELLDLPKTQIILHRGEGSRHKQLILPLTLKTQEKIRDLV